MKKKESAMPRKLNIGCGFDLRAGFVNADIREPCDVKLDMSKKPYPFKDNSFDYILMNNVLEHIETPLMVIEEIHRICSPAGTIEIIVPFYNSPNAYNDITHVRFFHRDTLKDFDINTKGKRYEASPVKFRIKTVLHPSLFGRLIPKPLLNVCAVTIGNLVAAVTYKLTPIKDENSPNE